MQGPLLASLVRIKRAPRLVLFPWPSSPERRSRPRAARRE
jgi:hypothetical protein